MDADFLLPEDWGFKWNSTLPQTYKGFVLRGAEVATVTGETGCIIIQTFAQPLFTIRFRIVELFRSARITFLHEGEGLMSFLALKNNIHCRFKGFGAVKLYPGQCSLFHCREQSFVASYEKNKIYHSLEISWSADIIKENAPYFTLLEQLLQPGHANKNFFVGEPNQEADNKLIDLAGEILKSPYDDTVSGLLFQHKVREYFILIMVAAGKVPPTGLHLTTEEWRKIDAIAERLKNEPDKKFPIVKLASKAQMNPTKLKEGFKNRYDSGMFEYQMTWRMKEAMRLLEETTLNPKEISAQIGYKRLGSFITKFREYYGYPPGKVIRNK